MQAFSPHVLTFLIRCQALDGQAWFVALARRGSAAVSPKIAPALLVRLLVPTQLWASGTGKIFVASGPAAPDDVFAEAFVLILACLREQLTQ